MRFSLEHLLALALVLLSSSAMGAAIAIDSFAVEPQELSLGDTFEVRATVTADGVVPVSAVLRLAESIARDSVPPPFSHYVEGRELAYFPDDGKSLANLLKAADTALYSAKEKGKNCYAYYESGLTEKAEYRFKFEQYLREAIDQKQLYLAYQPQVDTVTGDITAVEALARWHHPELGQVPPLEFVATAERIGMIKPLTDWVLHSACKQAVAWKVATGRSVRIAVNISPTLFLNRDFVESVKHTIDETGIDSGDLELEVTESVVQTDRDNLSIFQDLKDLGVSLAIDDFGRGYSSLASLKHLNVDCLKIDKYFIDDMLTDEDMRRLVSSMVEIGHNFRHRVVAEGVEDSEQVKIIQALGCESVQGYIFSKPVAADEIPKLLGKNFLD